MENKLISSLCNGEVKTFYRTEGAVDPMNQLRQRVVTAVYTIVKWRLGNKLVFKVHCSGCIFKRFDLGLGGQILRERVDWEKRAHRATALSRLKKNPIKLVIEIPQLSREELVRRMVRGGKKQKLVCEGEEEDLAVEYVRGFIERKVRSSFLHGLKHKSF